MDDGKRQQIASNQRWQKKYFFVFAFLYVCIYICVIADIHIISPIFVVLFFSLSLSRSTKHIHKRHDLVFCHNKLSARNEDIRLYMINTEWKCGRGRSIRYVNSELDAELE